MHQARSFAPSFSRQRRMRHVVWFFCLTMMTMMGSVPFPGLLQKADADFSQAVLAQDPPVTLQWQRIDDLPIGVFKAALSMQHDAAAPDGPARAIVTGGLTQAGIANAVVQVLDLHTLKWSTPAKLPAGVCEHAQITLADGRILVAGGRTGSLLEKLKATRKTWIISADLAAVTPGPDLPSPVANLTGHLLPDGRVMIVAGSTASIYDPAVNAWATHIALREKRSSHTSQCLPDGRVLIVGGIGRDSMEVVDPARKISTMLAPRLDGSRDDIASALLPDGRILLMGGQHTRTGLTTDEAAVIDLSNPRKATMQPIRPLGIEHGVADLAVASLGPWVFALGGESETKQGDVELTDARIIDGRSLEMWSLPRMTVAHDDAVAVAFGRSVIVIGGYAVSQVRIGPLQSRMPTAVHVVERLVLPSEKMPPR